MRRRFITLLANQGPSDTTAPTMVITCAQTSPSATTPLNFTFTADENTTDFDINSITVGGVGGTKSNFAGSGMVYTCDIAPTSSGAMTVDVAAGAFHDSAGNGNTAATQFTITFILILWKDEFATPTAAPLTSPRTAEVGTSVITDTGSAMPITANGLELTVVTGANADPRILTQSSYARAAGLALFGKIKDAGNSGLGFRETNTAAPDFASIVLSDLSSVPGIYLQLSGSHTLGYLVTGGSTNKCAIILRSTGMYYVINEKLIFVSTFSNASPLYAGYGVANVAGGIADYLRLAQLATPWTGDYGPGSLVVSGNIGAGQTFTHEADFLAYCTLTDNGSAGATTIDFRKQDANNYGQLSVSNDGSAALNEVVGGTPTTRRTAAAGTFANGERICIQAIGTSIRIFDAGAQQIYYASASNFATATSGVFSALATDAVLANLELYPVNLSGAALGVLRAVDP
jgi:hypothetical protein